jgi:hypothetical protein
MHDAGLRESAVGEGTEPLPCRSVALTAAPQRAQPERVTWKRKDAKVSLLVGTAW